MYRSIFKRSFRSFQKSWSKKSQDFFVQWILQHESYWCFDSEGNDGQLGVVGSRGYHKVDPCFLKKKEKNRLSICGSDSVLLSVSVPK